jgi:hypothetical protein
LVGHDWWLECRYVPKALEQGPQEIGELLAFGGREASEIIGLRLEDDCQCVLGKVGSGVG